MTLFLAILASVLYVTATLAYVRYMNKRQANGMITEIEQHLISRGFLRE